MKRMVIPLVALLTAAPVSAQSGEDIVRAS